MKELEDGFWEEKAEYFNLRSLLLRYWSYKKQITISVCVCVCLCIVYVLIATPNYEVTASVTIHDEERGGSKNEILSAEKLFYSGRDWLNTENEIEVLKSTSLIGEVVANLKLYASYSQIGFLSRKTLYKDTPIEVSIDNKDLGELKYPITIIISPQADTLTQVKVETTVNENVWEKTISITELPVVFDTPHGALTVSGNLKSLEESHKLEVILNNPVEVAKAYAEELSVDIVSRTSSVVKLTYYSPCRNLGIDFLKELIRCYNLNANFEKNRVAQRTAEFLKDRIAVIDKELEFTDERLEKFKREAGLTDIDFDTKEFLQENSRYTKEMLDAETQIYLLEYLRAYVSKEENKENIIPGDIGLKDQNLSKIIDNHNQLVLEFQRISRTSSKNNPVSLNLRNQIQASFEGVVNTLESVYSGAIITKNEIESTAKKYNARIQDIPALEKQLAEIVRQQETKASLYLDLLQKMEENSLIEKAITENAKFIDAPYSKMKPTSPNKKLLLMNDVAKLSSLLRLILAGSNKKIMCTLSGENGDGKSYISYRLASDFAHSGKKTLLVKIEENPLGTAKKMFSKWPINQVDKDDNLYECILSDNLENLQWVICNPNLESSLIQMNTQFDYIFIDSISLENLPCATELMHYTDFAIYICRVGHSKKTSINDFNALLQKKPSTDIALIINN